MCRYMFSLRGWMGTVEVKYEQRLVQILVSTEPVGRDQMGQGRGPRKGSKKGMAKDLKSLSGGERSFVNTCYTVALGDLITTPFHCLDEIDVFMDAHNRRVSLQPSHPPPSPFSQLLPQAFLLLLLWAQMACPLWSLRLASCTLF